MGAAAQFDRIGFRLLEIVAHGEHAHFVAIFLAEQASAPASIAWSVGISRVEVSEFWRITSFTWASMRSSSSGVTGLGWREIEAQPLGRDQRAFLADMRCPARASARHAADGWRNDWRGWRGGVRDPLSDPRRRPRRSLPSVTSTTWTCSAPSFFWVSMTSPSRLGREHHGPVSPAWPPDSRIERRLVGEDFAPSRLRLALSTRAPSLSMPRISPSASSVS